MAGPNSNTSWLSRTGSLWNGATYSSLSAVAFAITGTKWSGRRFFGVRRRDRVRANERSGDRSRRRRSESASALSERMSGQ